MSLLDILLKKVMSFTEEKQDMVRAVFTFMSRLDDVEIARFIVNQQLSLDGLHKNYQRMVKAYHKECRKNNKLIKMLIKKKVNN